MLNFLWLGLIVLSVICGTITGHIPDVVASVTDSTKAAFELALGMTGIMTFWLGLMKVAEASGLMQILARLLRPLMARLFPDVPSDHPAMGAIVLHFTANMLGLANAATPIGLRAMNELEKINKTPGTASNAMCVFMAMNTTCIQLIPATAISYLAAAGAKYPTDIIVTSFIGTCIAMFVSIMCAKIFEKLPFFRLSPTPENAENLS